ncbi:MAG: hypothetical protein IJB96_10815 [Lachnospira sp.]|nr:hypothetical protein [Lachnospira sp.]
MAEQNILNGGIAVLEQIIGDMQEHNSKVDRLDNLNDAIKGLNKEIESTEREIKAETDRKVSAATQAICEGYDKSIIADRAKIKQIQGEREKAKAAGVSERIAYETEALRKENEMLQGQIDGAFKQEKIPKFANSRLFFALFRKRDVKDFILGSMVTAAFLFLPVIVEVIVCTVADVEPVQGVYFIYLFALWVLDTLVVILVNDKIIAPHAVTIDGARGNKEKIANNNKAIKKITNGIRSDKSEDMYDLGKFDYDINALHDHIRNVEDEKAKALEEFEKNTKPDIVAEIENRFKERVTKAQDEIAKKTEEAAKLDELVKQQRIYISSNYEAYLGKEFMSLDKLQEMSGFMKSGIAETVGQAMAAYRDRH